MKTRFRKGFSLIELLVVIAILAVLAAILFPVFAQSRMKARAHGIHPDEWDMHRISLAVLTYVQDNDRQFPRTGADCADNTTHPAAFAPGEANQCGGNGWQDVVGPYVIGPEPDEAFLTHRDFSEAYDGPWGGGTGTDFNTTDDNLSFLMNDLLAHKTPTKAGGYADPASYSIRANGLKTSQIKTPAECVVLAEGHSGWDTDSRATPGTAVVTDWTGSTDMQNKWHHEYDLGANSTFMMSAAAYDGTRMIKIGLPFYNNGGLVSFADGHQKFVAYSNPDGTPLLCGTLPWARNIDPQQRNVNLDSCSDPNNPVAPSFSGSNWF